ncbi:LAETG motif-containing sortase-dependent surface protein [Streptomyces sp. NPDC037389]|uniref:LAETG motif-containing sortase-dependent surface protein n=1 Tax=Streptomyces sp. NPDC037389 TaxID=3155369 RepID=UPI0033DFE4A8
MKPTAKDTAAGGQMAATGAGSSLPWAVGGSAVALAAGAGMLVTARRRRATN